MKGQQEGLNTADESLHDRFALNGHRLSAAERRVVKYMLANTDEVPFQSAEEIGERAGTSNATVVRTAKALAYSGLPELKRSLGAAMAERLRPAEALHHRLDFARGDARVVIDRVFADAAESLEEVRRSLRPTAFDKSVELLTTSKRVLTFGVGPSEVPAAYMALRLSRQGCDARSVSVTGFRLADHLVNLTADDCVVLFAPARPLRELSVILDRANNVGAASVLITDTLEHRLQGRSSVVLSVPLSASGITGEAVAEIVLTDALMLATAGRNPERSLAASEQLNSLRISLIPGNPRPSAQDSSH